MNKYIIQIQRRTKSLSSLNEPDSNAELNYKSVLGRFASALSSHSALLDCSPLAPSALLLGASAAAAASSPAPPLTHASQTMVVSVHSMPPLVVMPIPGAFRIPLLTHHVVLLLGVSFSK